MGCWLRWAYLFVPLVEWVGKWLDEAGPRRRLGLSLGCYATWLAIWLFIGYRTDAWPLICIVLVSSTLIYIPMLFFPTFSD